MDQSAVCLITKETDSEATEKDEAIIALDWLQLRLGDQFTVTDHWEADLCAIGNSVPDDPAQLVYILCYGRHRWAFRC